VRATSVPQPSQDDILDQSPLIAQMHGLLARGPQHCICPSSTSNECRGDWGRKPQRSCVTAVTAVTDQKDGLKSFTTNAGSGRKTNESTIDLWTGPPHNGTNSHPSICPNWIFAVADAPPGFLVMSKPPAPAKVKDRTRQPRGGCH